MTGVLQVLEGSLVAASAYLMIGLAWSIVYSSCGYLNIAAGEFFVLAGVLAAKLPSWTGVSTPLVVVPTVIAATALLAFVVERVLIRPLPDRGLGPLIVLVGVSLVLGVVVTKLAPEVALRSADLVGGPPFVVAGVRIPRQDLFVVAGAAAIAVAVPLVAGRTDAGRTARAVADDRRAAARLGLPVPKVETAAFVVAMAVAAFAATLVTPMRGAAVGYGESVSLKAFLAVSIFGIANLRLAALGALIVAVAEAVLGRYWSTEGATLVVLAALLVVLVARPPVGQEGHRAAVA